MHKLRVRIGL